MGLKYVFGLSGSGKTEFCKESIKKSVEENIDKKVVYIVPEQFTLNGEYIMTDLLGGAIVSAEVLSFKRLSYNVFSEVGLVNLPILDNVGKNIVLRKIIGNLHSEGRLKYFDRAISRKGFIDKISATVSEFVHYLVTPEKLDLLIENAKENSTEENSAVLKYEDLKLIFTEYNNYLADKYISMENTPDYLAEYIKKSQRLKGADVYIDSFSGFTPQEISIIKELLLICENVYICLSFSEKIDLEGEEGRFCEPAAAVRMLNKVCADIGIKAEKAFDGGKENKRQRGILSKISGDLKIQDKDDETIKIIKADTKYSEIKYAANEINRLARYEDVKYSDIGVILGNTEYLPYVKNTFKKFDIAFFADNKVSAANHPLSQLIVSYIKVFIYNFKHEDIFKALKTGFFEGYNDITGDDLFQFENYVLEYGKNGIQRYNKEWKIKCPPNVENVRKQIYELLMSDECKLNSKKEYPAEEISKKIYAFLKNINAPKTLAQWANKEENPLIDSKIYKQVWDIIYDIINKMNDILSEKLAIKDYCDIFSAAVESTSVGFIPSKLDGCLIGDIDRSRFPSIKYLFILGANDGVFPPVVRDLGFISDKERIEARKKGVELASESDRIIKHNEFLIYSAFSVPTERLYISYAVSSITGSAIAPAASVKKILLQCENIREIQVSKEDLYIASRSTAFEAFLQMARTAERDEEYKDVQALWNVLREKYPEYERAVRASILKLEQRQNLCGGILDKLYKGGDIFSSISKIETFNKCPFQYFANYILRLRERASADISSIETGNTQHELLCLLLEAVKDDNFNKMSQNDLNKYIDNAIKKYKDEEKDDYAVYEISGKNKHIFERIERNVRTTASAIVSQINHNDVLPQELELSFDEKKSSKYKSYKLPLGDGTNVNFTGKIDRVDLFEHNDKEYVRIIDYKSSDKQLNRENVELGLQIQLIMYLNIYLQYKEREAKDGRHFNPAGAFYMEVGDKGLEKKDLSESIDKDVEKMRSEYKVKGISLNDKEIYERLNASTAYKVDNEEFQEIFDKVENGVKKSCRQIKAGNIKVEPVGEKDACDYCKYYPICSRDSLEEYSRPKGNSEEIK